MKYMNNYQFSVLCCTRASRKRKSFGILHQISWKHVVRTYQYFFDLKISWNHAGRIIHIIRLIILVKTSHTDTDTYQYFFDTYIKSIQWINSIKCLLMTLRCPVTILSVPCPWRHPYLRREFLRRTDRSLNSNLDILQCLKCCENAPWSLLWSSPLRVPHSRISSWCNLQQTTQTYF